MIKKYILNPCQYEKWIFQNSGEVVDFLEGNLLDSVLVNCRGGVAMLQEHFVNTWTSDFLVTFCRWSDRDGVNDVIERWDNFADSIGLGA